LVRASISLAVRPILSVVPFSLAVVPIALAVVPIALAAGVFALALPATALAAVVSGAGPQPAPPPPPPPPPSPTTTGSPPGPTLTPKQLRRANRGANPLLGSPTGATPPPAGTPSPAAGAGGVPGATATGELTGEKEFNSCKKFPANRRIVKLNMKPDTDLGDLISWISSITCKQFVLPGTIPANSKKVTIIAPQLITPEEAYRLFLSALDSVGLTVAPSGKFLRIIETPRAKTSPIPLWGQDGEMQQGEAYVTRLLRVENADVNEVAQVLGRLKGEQGDVIVFAPQGALIITDTSANITRMMSIVRELDQAGTGEKIWIVEIKNTAATEMAQKLGEIFQVAQLGGKGRAPTSGPPPGAPGGKQPPKVGDLTSEMMVSKIIPDERSNQLIVIANERAYARLLTLVRKLDVPLEGGDGRIHVYYCENANCDELAQTLGAVTGVAVSGAAGGRARARGGAAPPPAPTPGGAPGQGPSLLFEGDVRINFDRPTNSLIVVSSLKDYQSLRRVIERLDSPRKQVFVEALILEVTLDKNRELGGSFHGALPETFGATNQSLVIGGFNPAKTLNPASLLGETMLAGVLGPVLQPDQARSLGFGATSTLDIPSFGVLVKALQTNSDVDVLSNPHLLIMNNEEGEISVGSRIPFPVSTIGLGGGAPGAAGANPLAGLGIGGLFPQVQREKVALEMKLVPHVNEHDIIRLEVDEKISEVAPGASNLGPSTSERTAKTIVVAKDQQTILIGGLMSDKVINSVQKIPLLGDIPIIGFFFRDTTRHVVKTNLIIALTPYVIADQTDLRRVLEKKMKERREFVERFGGEERPNPEAQVDYRRKRGMLEEINRAAREVEEEDRAEQDIREKLESDHSGEIESPSQAGSKAVEPGPAPPAPESAPPTAPPSTAPPPPPASPPPPPAASPPLETAPPPSP
jgi:general secretion pathway protein D